MDRRIRPYIPVTAGPPSDVPQASREPAVIPRPSAPQRFVRPYDLRSSTRIAKEAVVPESLDWLEPLKHGSEGERAKHLADIVASAIDEQLLRLGRPETQTAESAHYVLQVPARLLPPGSVKDHVRLVVVFNKTEGEKLALASAGIQNQLNKGQKVFITAPAPAAASSASDPMPEPHRRFVEEYVEKMTEMPDQVRLGESNEVHANLEDYCKAQLHAAREAAKTWNAAAADYLVEWDSSEERVTTERAAVARWRELALAHPVVLKAATRGFLKQEYPDIQEKDIEIICSWPLGVLDYARRKSQGKTLPAGVSLKSKRQEETGDQIPWEYFVKHRDVRTKVLGISRRGPDLAKVMAIGIRRACEVSSESGGAAYKSDEEWIAEFKREGVDEKAKALVKQSKVVGVQEIRNKQGGTRFTPIWRQPLSRSFAATPDRSLEKAKMLAIGVRLLEEKRRAADASQVE